MEENWKNLAENQKKVWFCRNRRTRFLQLWRYTVNTRDKQEELEGKKYVL